jgi:hypothetical protein
MADVSDPKIDEGREVLQPSREECLVTRLYCSLPGCSLGQERDKLAAVGLCGIHGPHLRLIYWADRSVLPSLIARIN